MKTDFAITAVVSIVLCGAVALALDHFGIIPLWVWLPGGHGY